MNIYALEKAAEIVFAMCRQHPELCPHDWGWVSTNLNTGEKKYKCNICGKQKTLKEEEVGNERNRSK